MSCVMIMRVAGAVKSREMNMSLNQCQAFMKQMLLTEVLNHCIISTLLANVMNRTFELGISAVLTET